MKSGERVQDVASETAARHAGNVTALMPHLDMFAVSLPNEMAAEAVANDPRVLLVQEDGVLHLAECRLLDPYGSQWALTQVNNRSETGEFGANIGSYLNRVSVYVIDSVINPYSSDFMYQNGGNKIRQLADFSPACADDGGDHPPFKVGDGVNHGSAVASIIGGNVHGIAPGISTIYSIVAVDCLGRSSDTALSNSADYVLANHQAGAAAVANISIVADFPDEIFDAAVQRMVSNGVFVAAAAGNRSTNACSSSPAELGGLSRTAGFMAVGATNIYGATANYSNYGDCVDIWAPGGETDPYNASDKGVMTSEGAVTGTSFAAPHVAGAALVIYSRYPSWSNSSVWYQIKADSLTSSGRLMLKIPNACPTYNACAGWCPQPPQQ